MATDALPPDNPVRRIVEQTGGSIVTETDPRRWVQSLRTLLRAASPRYLQTSPPLRVSFTDAGPALPPLAVSPWNRTWIKSAATELARGRTGADDELVPAAGAWFSGNGAVIAVAFHADAGVVAALARRVALPPRDPRFKIAWDPGARLSVTLDAADADRPINDLSPRLKLFDADAASLPAPRDGAIPIPQTAPGRYELSVPAPARPAFASVSIDGRPIDRIAVAGRYAPEFDAIGNDLAAMRELAQTSGGAVIEPAQTTPIDFRWPVRHTALSSWLAACGAALIGAGLIVWRRSH